MADETKVTVKLADGTQFGAMPDGAGNYIIDNSIDVSVFTQAALSKVIITEDGHEQTYLNQVLRTYYAYDIGSILIRLDGMTDYEKLESANSMLEECILEMSEIIYA